MFGGKQKIWPLLLLLLDRIILFLCYDEDHYNDWPSLLQIIDCIRPSTQSNTCLMIARRRICIQRVRGGQLRRQSRQLAAGALNVLGQRRLGGGGALLGFGEAGRGVRDGRDGRMVQ